METEKGLEKRIRRLKRKIALLEESARLARIDLEKAIEAKRRLSCTAPKTKQ